MILLRFQAACAAFLREWRIHSKRCADCAHFVPRGAESGVTIVRADLTPGANGWCEPHGFRRAGHDACFDSFEERK